MTIQVQVSQWTTFVPLTFERAVTGPPVLDAPDVDNRGFRDDEHGPVVGMTAGDTVRVALKKMTLDPAAPLFLTSTDTGVVELFELPNGALPAGERAEFRIHALPGTDEVRTARIEAHFGGAGGPVLGELTVRVFLLHNVSVTPHTIAILDSTGGGVAVLPELPRILELVSAYWRPCGIGFTVEPTLDDSVTLTTAGVVKDRPWPGDDGSRSEIPTILNVRPAPNSINVYFVHRIGVANILGYGFSPPNARRFHMPHPGILLAETDHQDLIFRDPEPVANDLAHEIGHFLTLEHYGNRQIPRELEDTWARRNLMHPYNLMYAHEDWPYNVDGHPAQNRPLVNNVGYGDYGRGGLVTLKDLPGIAQGDQTTIARSVLPDPGTLYGTA
jgi:hypothetical protein